MLARFELLGDYALKDTFLTKVRAITAADLMRVARAWFPPERKSVGVLVPKP
jgi:predicted Zn-dependent peptidase